METKSLADEYQDKHLLGFQDPRDFHSVSLDTSEFSKSDLHFEVGAAMEAWRLIESMCGSPQYVVTGAGLGSYSIVAESPANGP